DPLFFNVAPPDQWIGGMFDGHEEFLVENMHADKTTITGRLPGLAIRTFATCRTSSGPRFVQVPMWRDTLWLFPSVNFGVVASHGVLDISDDDAADVDHLLVACENARSGRPVEHYRRALDRRLDDDGRGLAGLSDTDLMPGKDSGIAPNVDGFDVGR